jgi:two-component system chemotaxis response regulator CheY
MRGSTVTETSVAPATPDSEPPPPHILVVDDATVLRLYYRHILEAEGYRVDEAMNGVEGLEKAMRTPFDLCVVDVNMPVMDGYAFLRALRREPATHAVPALMISTEAGPQDRRLAREAGANFYLVKPVAQDRMALHVAAMLGRPPPGQKLGGQGLSGGSGA